jgi:hypothetical protein
MNYGVGLRNQIFLADERDSSVACNASRWLLAPCVARRAFGAARLVCAAFHIQAGILDYAPLQRTTAHDVSLDEFLYVLRRHISIPHRLRIHHNNRPVLTLIETAGLIDAELPFQPTLCNLTLEDRMQFTPPSGIATTPRMRVRPLIDTDKHMLLILWHKSS